MPRDVPHDTDDVAPNNFPRGKFSGGDFSRRDYSRRDYSGGDYSGGGLSSSDISPGGVITVSDTLPGRVEETAPRYPSYTWLMLVLSAAYVVLTLAFGSRLLEAMTGRLGDAQFAAIRDWTQALFGCALTLFLWGTVIFPRLERSQLSWRLRWLALVVSGAIGAAGGSYVERATLDYLLANQDGVVGRQAVQLHTLTQAILDTRQPVQAIAVPAELLSSPTGKAFLLLFLGTELYRADGGVRASTALSGALEGLVAQRIGTAAQVYDNLFVPSVRSLRDAFNAYVAAQTALAEDVRAIPERQALAWTEFQDGLAQRGLPAVRRPRTDWPAIAVELRQMGIPVPTDWNPTDRAGFAVAVGTHLRQQADNQYSERVTRLIGTELAPGLEWEQFVAHADVQARWRAGIGAPAHAALSPTMGFRAFSELVYRPMLNRVVDPKLGVLTGPAENFAVSGGLHDAAAAALSWITVPAVALSLALIGGLWHAAAFACYLGLVLAPASRLRRRLVLGSIVLVGLLVLGQRSPITRTLPFTQMEDRIADHAGPIWLVARGSVETVGLVSRSGNLVRRIVLGNYNFGLDPFARRTDDLQSSLDRLAP